MPWWIIPWLINAIPWLFSRGIFLTLWNFFRPGIRVWNHFWLFLEDLLGSAGI